MSKHNPFNSMEEYQEVWLRTFREKGHTPVLTEDGKPDRFAHSSPGHNGPKCSVCGWSCCYWCVIPPRIPECLVPKKAGKKRPKKRNDDGDASRDASGKKAALRLKDREAISV